MKQVDIEKITVSGHGETQAASISAALSQIQRTVLKHSSRVLLRIEPIDVDVINASLTKRREAFLFVFFSRERMVYHVTLDVTVQVTSIDTDQIDFKSS